MLIVMNLDRFRRVNESLGQDAATACCRKSRAGSRRTGSGQGREVGRAFNKTRSFARVVARAVPIVTTRARSVRRFAGAFIETFTVDEQGNIVSWPPASACAPTMRPTPRDCWGVRRVEMFEARLPRVEEHWLGSDDDPARGGSGRCWPRDTLRHQVQHGELFLLYQPQIELASGGLACYEAERSLEPRPQLGRSRRARPFRSPTRPGFIQEVSATRCSAKRPDSRATGRM